MVNFDDALLEETVDEDDSDLSDDLDDDEDADDELKDDSFGGMESDLEE
jgi:hypothetical protein